jgi:prophage regulatory protein
LHPLNTLPSFNNLKGSTMATGVLRRPDVEALTGLSRSTIYKFMKDGTFPKAVKIGPRAVGWRQTDIEDWLSNLTNG